MSPQTIEALRRVIDPTKLHNRLLRAQAAIAEYSKVRIGKNVDINANLASNLGQGPRPMDTFPVATGVCTSANGSDVTRIPAAIVLAADVVWFAADSVRELAQDVCKEELVVAGEGGNTSLACAVVDAVWIVAKAVNEGIHFCDDDLTGDVIDANYGRLAFINDEIGNLQGSVNNVGNQVSNVGTQVSNVGAQITALDTHLTNVDTHVANEFSTLDAHLVALFAALSTQVANVQTSVDLANQRLLKSIAVQTQIMKLDLTPEGSRILIPSILTCTGSNCPNPLSACTGPNGGCAWNSVGPLP
jgi:hypothetical protein